MVTVTVVGPTTLPAGTTTQLTATVTNDAANQGVAWTVSCATLPCGSASPTTTASGVATTYTAPAGLSAAESVTITATSRASPT